MAWTQSGNIKGASGSPGASGASGLQGASGVPGASGPTGASGPIGATGPAGTTTWSGITDKPAVIAAGVDAAAARNVISAEYTGNKNQPSGYCGLDSSGLVPSSNLPSFVDDVVEAANLTAFPATGESGKIYTALDTNKVYRWGGSSYTEISPSPGSTDAVPEGSTNLYYTAARADGRITAAVGSTVQAYSATLTTYASKTAPTGAVVGTTDTQTLTNKDLSGSSNTFPAFIKRSIATITSPTTLGSAANTDYVTFCSLAGSDTTSTSLLNFNGSNNSTTFTDSVSSSTTWTASGNAKLSTSVKKYGTASLSLDGTNSYISTPANSRFKVNSTFTCEAWIYTANVNSDYRCIFAMRNENVIAPFFITQYGSNIGWYVGNAALSGWAVASPSGSAAGFTAGTWSHVAVVGDGTNINVYVNGSSKLSTTQPAWSSADRLMVIGNDVVQGWFFNGYIDDYRFSNTARYTASFTPPTAEFAMYDSLGTPTLPTAVSNTNRYSIRNYSGYPLTVGVTSSQQINGATGGLALSTGSTVELVSDGSGWWSM